MRGFSKCIIFLVILASSLCEWPTYTIQKIFNIPDLMQELKEKRPDVKSVILCGIETHACIYHTSLDLIADHDIDVHVVVDCCSSR